MGHETSLSQCNFNRSGVHDCGGINGVGVVCDTPEGWKLWIGFMVHVNCLLYKLKTL
jgi:hypothetical protein